MRSDEEMNEPDITPTDADAAEDDVSSAFLAPIQGNTEKRGKRRRRRRIGQSEEGGPELSHM